MTTRHEQLTQTALDKLDIITRSTMKRSTSVDDLLILDHLLSATMFIVDKWTAIQSDSDDELDDCPEWVVSHP